MFKFPEIEGAGNPNILTGVPEGFVVSSKTEYPDECVEFLKWFLGKDVGTEQAQTIGWFNASKGTTEGVENQSLLDAYDVITSAEKWTMVRQCSVFHIMYEYLTDVSDLTNGDTTPEEAMTKIQAKAKKHRNCSLR